MDIIDLRRKLIKQTVEKEILQKNLAETKSSLEKEEMFLDNCQKARTIVQIVAQETQAKVEYHISNLVSMALSSVFPDPYEFSLRFVQRRNKTEADLLFVKDGKEGYPLDMSGGGPIDVASFALRVATWSIKPTRRTIVLDEPGKFISRDLQIKFSEMIKHLSSSLGLQFIIVSHVPEITEAADKIFEVTNKNGESKVIVMERK
jgi:DNA repair exonuclease SbcCD ATPase subunit